MSWPVQVLTAATTLRSRSWAVASVLARTSCSRATSLMETPGSPCIKARVSALEVQRHSRHPVEEAYERPSSKSAGSAPKWGQWSIDVPECLGLLELPGNGWVTV